MARLDAPLEPEMILASRVYRVEGDNGGRDLRIAIAVPVRLPNGRYECRAEIGDEHRRVVRPLNGADALEALLLAVINIGSELHLFTNVGADQFTWLAGNEVGLGFPTLPDFSLRSVIGPQ
jgi:hypothetical protein